MNEINLFTQTLINKKSTSAKLFFLHGFTGSGKDWSLTSKNIIEDYELVTVDLIGHGRSDSPQAKEHYTAGEIVKQLDKSFSEHTKDKFFLCGYSMGGRAALNYAVHYPGKLKALILESSTAGIKEDDLRKERTAADEKLADFIMKHSVEEFIDYWMNIDLFSTQKRFSNDKLKKIKEEKLTNKRIGLANSLRGFSTGKMEPLYDQLKIINCPVLLLTGELDTRYTAISAGMKDLFANAEHKIIKNSGHNTHLEEPQKFIDEVNWFLAKIK